MQVAKTFKDILNSLRSTATKVENVAPETKSPKQSVMKNTKLAHTLFILCAIAFRQDQITSILDLTDEQRESLESSPLDFLKDFYGKKSKPVNGSKKAADVARRASGVLNKLNNSMSLVRVFKDYKNDVALALEQKEDTFIKSLLDNALNLPQLVSPAILADLSVSGGMIRSAVAEALSEEE